MNKIMRAVLSCKGFGGEVEITIKGTETDVANYCNILAGTVKECKAISGDVDVFVHVANLGDICITVDASVAHIAKALEFAEIEAANTFEPQYVAHKRDGKPIQGTKSIPAILYGNKYHHCKRNDDIPSSHYYGLSAWE